MDREKFKNVLETLLFVTNRPLGLLELSDIAGETQEDVRAMVSEIGAELDNRKSALQVVGLGEGYQLASREGYGYWVKKLFRDQTTYKLSQSAMETLSIVAYKQPISRAEIEEIRGVEVTGVLDTLVDRRLVRVAGRKETVGRPLLYATTEEFLRHFHLWKVSELPSLEDLAKEAERNKGLEAAPVPQETAAPDTQALPPPGTHADSATPADPLPEQASPSEPAVENNGHKTEQKEPEIKENDP